MVGELMRFLTEIVMYAGLALITFMSYVITGWIIRFLKKHPRSYTSDDDEEFFSQQEEEAKRYRDYYDTTPPDGPYGNRWGGF